MTADDRGSGGAFFWGLSGGTVDGEPVTAVRGGLR